MEMTPVQPRRPAVPFGRASRLVLAATVGRDTLDMRINALMPLILMLGQGSVALFDDGTLAGADRVRLARRCGDPLILSANGQVGSFPDGPDWALLLAALDQRRNAYWVTVGGSTPEELLPDLARAIASNRSFMMVEEGKAAGPIAPHLDRLARDGFPYIDVSPRLLGFAASGDGLALAASVLAREREPVLIRDKPPAVHSPSRILML
jgi:hypothetical protein